MGLLDNYDQILSRPEIAGTRHNQCLIDVVDGNNTSNGTIPYGSIVVIDGSVTNAKDANNPPVKIIATASEIIVGLAFLEYTNEESFNIAGDAGYPDKAQLPIAKMGEFKVFSETANNYGDPVFVRIVAGTGGNKIGYGFRKTAVAGETVAIPNAYWVKRTATGNNISAIRIRF
jgi:hypothetical protein